LAGAQVSIYAAGISRSAAPTLLAQTSTNLQDQFGIAGLTSSLVSCLADSVEANAIMKKT
jgi:hypothetical protein